MKLYLTILFALLFVGFAFESTAQLVTLSGADGRPIMKENRLDIDGSPFFLDEYLSTKLLLKNDFKEREAIGRLNFLNRTFEFKNEGELLEISFSEIQSLIMEDPEKGTLNFINGANLKLDKSSLYLVMYEGVDLSFLKEYNYKLSDAQSSSYAGGEAKRKIMDSETLLLKNSDSSSEFRRNSKSFNSILPQNLRSIADDYLKKNKVNWKNDDEIIQFIDFLDSNL